MRTCFHFFASGVSPRMLAAGVALISHASLISNAWAQSAPTTKEPAVAATMAQSPAIAAVPAEPPPRAAAAATPPAAQPVRPSKPDWSELSADQQLALKPLAGKWHELSANRKRKWIELSRNFKTLPADEQAKMHGRMTEWVALSQQQRAQARLNYVEAQKLAPAEKSAKWQAYQELSAEEKKRLAEKAPAGLPGAAAVKPHPPQRLATVPFTRNSPKDEAQANATGMALHQHTLLPHPSPDPATPAKH